MHAIQHRIKHRISHVSRFAGLAVVVAVLTSCADAPTQRFDGASPAFDPIAYFEGPTHAWGVLESRDGTPKSRFRADLVGRRDAGALVLTQDFTFEDGRRQQRIWRFHRVDAHRYDATADGVIGVATGHVHGNAFRWEYTLQLTPGNPLTRVRMHHWMYLAGDGATLINRVTIRKFGLQVGGTTEYFQRGAAVTPSITAPP
ncbi:MAG: DUF3833 family protein [Luteimonas sp.]